MFGSIAEEMQGHADDSTHDRHVADPFERAFPNADEQRNLRILGKAAVFFGMLNIVQHIDHVRTADAGGIVDACVGMGSMLAQLSRAFLRDIYHVLFAAEMETSGGASLDTCRLKPGAHAIGAQGTLM